MIQEQDIVVFQGRGDERLALGQSISHPDLRLCPSGKDPLGRYWLTEDFYAGVFEITEAQWLQVMGFFPLGWFEGKGTTRPMTNVSYNMIRGSRLGRNWPRSSAVDSESFIGRLRAKTGLKTLDLPTEAQWEYACRAGATTEYNIGNGEPSLSAAGWYSKNFGTYNLSDGMKVCGRKPVGEKTENAWGLYDMHGNVDEWCLDYSKGELLGENPVGVVSGRSRVIRGGSWNDEPKYCTASYSASGDPGVYSSCTIFDLSSTVGFRLFRTVP